MKDTKKYWLFVAISFDQFINSVFKGNPYETISARMGKRKIKYGGTIPWRRPIMRFIDNCLEIVDDNHCIEAIDAEKKRIEELRGIK